MSAGTITQEQESSLLDLLNSQSEDEDKVARPSERPAYRPSMEQMLDRLVSQGVISNIWAIIGSKDRRV